MPDQVASCKKTQLGSAAALTSIIMSVDNPFVLVDPFGLDWIDTTPLTSLQAQATSCLAAIEFLYSRKEYLAQHAVLVHNFEAATRDRDVVIRECRLPVGKYTGVGARDFAGWTAEP